MVFLNFLRFLVLKMFNKINTFMSRYVNYILIRSMEFFVLLHGYCNLSYLNMHFPFFIVHLLFLMLIHFLFFSFNHPFSFLLICYLIVWFIVKVIFLSYFLPVYFIDEKYGYMFIAKLYDVKFN